MPAAKFSAGIHNNHNARYSIRILSTSSNECSCVFSVTDEAVTSPSQTGGHQFVDTVGASEYEQLDANRQTPVSYQQLPARTAHQDGYYDIRTVTESS